MKSKEKLSKRKPQKMCDYIDFEASLDNLPGLTLAVISSLFSIFALAPKKKKKMIKKNIQTKTTKNVCLRCI